MQTVIVGSLLVSLVSALWPVQISYADGNSTVVLASDFSIEFHGPNGTRASGCVDTSGRVLSAINQTYELLHDGFVPSKLHLFEENFEPTVQEMTSAQTLKKLIVYQKYTF